jgi:hypothetical protein
MNTTDRNLLIATYVLLFFLNIFFALGKWCPGLPLISDCFEFITEYKGTITFLEILGVMTIFAEMILNYDSHESKIRNLKLVGVVVLTFAFIAKVFVNYLDSALLQ